MLKDKNFVSDSVMPDMRRTFLLALIKVGHHEPVEKNTSGLQHHRHVKKKTIIHSVCRV